MPTSLLLSSLHRLLPHSSHLILLLLFLLPILSLTLLLLTAKPFLLRLRMPPGPLPLPLLGNKPHLARSKPWLHLHAWASTYGPLYTIWLSRSRPTLIISDPVVASELMESPGRSGKFSSRPRMVALGELYWNNASILVQPYGKGWSVRRRLLHLAMTGRRLAGYKGVQEAEGVRLCFGLLGMDGEDGGNKDNDNNKNNNSNSQKYVSLIETFTASIVFCVAYGHRIDSLHARVIKQRFAFMQYAASLNVPGRYLVETLPWLKHVPDFLAPWKAEIKAAGRREAEANGKLMDLVKREMETAKVARALLSLAEAEAEEKSLKAEERQRLERESQLPESLCSLLLELREAESAPEAHQQPPPSKSQGTADTASLTARDLSFIPASLFGAGSDTTASTLCSALLALVTHPETLVAAHQELDRVVSLPASRSPTFADEPSLPYLRALCKEVLRWRPVAVLGGTPHASTEDDYYRGYYIPAGTTVLGNSWAINMNEAYYPNPHHFNPLRFLDENVAARVKRSASNGNGNDNGNGNGDRDNNHDNNHDKEPEIGGKAHPSKSGHSSFGWGRRICPGAQLASNSLFIALAKILWAFDIKPVPGVQYDIFDYTEGFNVRPRPFKCAITVRSEAHKRVLEREQQEAMAYLEKYTPFSE
ncbi:cytochrome P450 [Coniella lustricola]|uniref:Cytochrome P450 n=1 Tax=Coniella lustricola TaxID=2025994 RepID=A0A2T3A8F1_9PEZI|nr:cytochrome P450 [Coniella lustricola]